jgi:hypothetical protein
VSPSKILDENINDEEDIANMSVYYQVIRCDAEFPIIVFKSELLIPHPYMVSTQKVIFIRISSPMFSRVTVS